MCLCVCLWWCNGLQKCVRCIRWGVWKWMLISSICMDPKDMQTHTHTHTNIRNCTQTHTRSAHVVSPTEVASFSTRHLDAYLNRLHDANVAIRRGYAAAIGALPALLLQDRAEEVCQKPCMCVCV